MSLLYFQLEWNKEISQSFITIYVYFMYFLATIVLLSLVHCYAAA